MSWQNVIMKADDLTMVKLLFQEMTYVQGVLAR